MIVKCVFIFDFTAQEFGRKLEVAVADLSADDYHVFQVVREDTHRPSDPMYPNIYTATILAEQWAKSGY